MIDSIKPPIDDCLFDFAYKMALRDAVLQKAYEDEKKHLEENYAAKNIIKKYIKSIFDNKQPEFKRISKEVEESFEEFHKGKQYAQFSFGNTQKLINMTAKYMFIATYNEGKKRKLFDCCHCPVDRIMLKKVAERIDDLPEEDKNKLREKVPIIKGNNGKEVRLFDKGWKSVFTEPWSQITEDRYDAFQAIVKHLAENKRLSPIEFDYVYWGSE